MKYMWFRKLFLDLFLCVNTLLLLLRYLHEIYELRVNRKGLPCAIRLKKWALNMVKQLLIRKGHKCQLSSYYDPKRKSLAWYKKIPLDVLIWASVINAMLLYQKYHSTTNRKLSMQNYYRRSKKLLGNSCNLLNNGSDASANTLTNSPNHLPASSQVSSFWLKFCRKRTI